MRRANVRECSRDCAEPKFKGCHHRCLSRLRRVLECAGLTALWIGSCQKPDRKGGLRALAYARASDTAAQITSYPKFSEIRIAIHITRSVCSATF